MNMIDQMNYIASKSAKLKIKGSLNAKKLFTAIETYPQICLEAKKKAEEDNWANQTEA